MNGDMQTRHGLVKKRCLIACEILSFINRIATSFGIAPLTSFQKTKTKWVENRIVLTFTFCRQDRQ